MEEKNKGREENKEGRKEERGGEEGIMEERKKEGEKTVGKNERMYGGNKV